MACGQAGHERDHLSLCSYLCLSKGRSSSSRFSAPITSCTHRPAAFRKAVRARPPKHTPTGPTPHPSADAHCAVRSNATNRQRFVEIHPLPTHHGIHIIMFTQPNDMAHSNMNSTPDHTRLTALHFFDENLDNFPGGTFAGASRIPDRTRPHRLMAPAAAALGTQTQQRRHSVDVVLNAGLLSLLPKLALARRDGKPLQDPTRSNLKVFCPGTHEGNSLFTFFFVSLPFQTCATCSKKIDPKPGSRNKGSSKFPTLSNPVSKFCP